MRKEIPRGQMVFFLDFSTTYDHLWKKSPRRLCMLTLSIRNRISEILSIRNQSGFGCWVQNVPHKNACSLCINIWRSIQLIHSGWLYTELCPQTPFVQFVHCWGERGSRCTKLANTFFCKLSKILYDINKHTFCLWTEIYNLFT